MPASLAEEDQVAAAFSVFRLWLDCRRTQRELALFSERDLADLGLVRSDMSRAAALRATR
ncbi:DUF1127 domain-containing protein [Methylobacterium phyllosphaerae]